jgi:hypothetical protein
LVHQGIPGSAQWRQSLIQAQSLNDLASALDQLAADLEFPLEAMRIKRGKKSRRQRGSLPEGYLDDRFDATLPGPESEDSGG